MGVRLISKNIEDIQFEFPLFKMWEEILKDHHTLTNVREVRRQLDTQDVDNFDWQPYDRYNDELVDCVNEGDRSLFRSAVTMVDRFPDWQLESFEKLEKMADASQMNSFVKSMQRKVETFKKAWSSGFVSFNVENCINSTFDEEGKADVRSPSPNTPVGSPNGVYGLSPNPHTSPHMFHSSHSTMTPIHVSTPQSVRSQILVNLSTPQSSSKDFIVLGGPDESSGQSGGAGGRNKMGSIVGRMKANPRKATYIPLLKSPYYIPKKKREKVSRPNPNSPILDDICSTIPKEEMHKTLKKSWMDTLIMDYWLGIVGEHCADTFFPSTLAVDLLRQKFLDIGWCDPVFWTFETGNPNPQQTNK
ncbi:hypothetical protein MRB53_010508 [Persea americana]|uniref:Uncharacterized protein n=1 Tax=Persea americana TaxID=3435 RepID=A0ACC2LS47_PERAE|nr:hypothetical protein MRB53_010508 [Persea americana]